MAVRVGINGLGRIGRQVLRVMIEHREFEVVAINDLADAKALAHLLRYDSVHGRFHGAIEVRGNGLAINGAQVEALCEKDPAKLPWASLGVDTVVEATGVFRYYGPGDPHLSAGARNVVLTTHAPPGDADATIILGVNEHLLRPEHQTISCASGPTHCAAPLLKILNDSIGIEKGLATIVHAYTNDQRLCDNVHRDARRARAAAVNIIPTHSFPRIDRVMPELAGRINGMTIRTPVADGSAIDMTLELRTEPTAEEVNAAVRAAADTSMRGIVAYCEDPIVSSDVIGCAASCLFDSLATLAVGRLVKVLGWFDNEVGYANRVCDLVRLVAHL